MLWPSSSVRKSTNPTIPTSKALPKSSSGNSAAYPSQRLPTLEQVLQLFATNHGLLYIEMKSGAGEGDQLAAAVVKTVKEADLAPRVVVEDFALEGIAEVIIRKQRNGPTGTVRMAFLKSSTRFESLAGGGDVVEE